FGRRARELRTEDGWGIATRFTGRPDLHSGEYVLESIERVAEPHDRRIPHDIQKEVYARDDNKCQLCGWNRDRWTAADPRILDLPGCPDIAFPSLKSCIFVHGCFWHGHTKCSKGHRPTSNVEFWNNKIDKNIRRDETVRRRLRSLGWRRLVIWECQLRAPALE